MTANIPDNSELNKSESTSNGLRIDFEKLAKIQRWERYEGETWEDVFHRKNIRPQDLPTPILIDVRFEIGLEGWAKKGDFNSLDELESAIIEIFHIAEAEPISHKRELQKLFPTIHGFCIYATKIARSGKIESEARKIAEQCWWGVLATKRLKKQTDKVFSIEPDPIKYIEAVKKIKAVYNFDDIEIDAFRYFICQTRNESHNPSLNKSLYLYGRTKQTGKTTLARALASVLNGGTSVLDGTNYESTFNKEMQINDHDLPLAAQFNCVILDEAMPKDSRKSYGLIKAMLTASTCRYNQKFGRITTIPVKRYYIYTSNDSVSDYIQDATERRFIQIYMNRKPKQISFEEIYNIWLEFAQNCQPEEDWQEWYNSFDSIEGVQRKEIDYLKAEILNNQSIFSILEFKSLNQDYSVTQAFFNEHLIKGKPTRDERANLKEALTELFGEPKYYKWETIHLTECLREAREQQK